MCARRRAWDRTRCTAYGLSREEYRRRVDEATSRQGGRCAVCRQAKKLDYDHCHRTGVFRGMLCGDCNRGLGLFRDNPDSLRAAIGYLTVSR